jgi:hypothetical protein
VLLVKEINSSKFFNIIIPFISNPNSIISFKTFFIKLHSPIKIGMVNVRRE